MRGVTLIRSSTRSALSAVGRRDLSQWARVVRQIPSVSGLSRSEFLARRGFPFVIRAAHSAPGWSSLLLKERAGCALVPVYVSADGSFPGGQGPYDERRYLESQMTVSELLDRWSGAPLEPLLAPQEHYYVYQMPAESLAALKDAFPDPDYLPAIEVSSWISRNFWIGNEGNITPIHYDVAENLLLQVFGSKRVLLWSPDQCPLLYLRPLGVIHDRQSHLDVFEHDPVRFPAFEQASAIEATLEPGDTLYLPAFWAHYVRTLDASMSVNYWWPLDETIPLLAMVKERSLTARSLPSVLTSLFSSRPALLAFWHWVLAESGTEAVMRFLEQYREE